jgi:hypothetical protein
MFLPLIPFRGVQEISNAELSELSVSFNVKFQHALYLDIKRKNKNKTEEEEEVSSSTFQED